MGRSQQRIQEYLQSDSSSAGSAADLLASDPERLAPEWEVESAGSEESGSSDADILRRLENIEKRLEGFESTCYSFLLYAKQLTDRTVSFFEDIFGLSSDDLAQIHDRLGVNFNNRGSYTEAIQAFRKLVELDRSPAACYKLGVALANSGELEEAVEAFRSAVDLDAAYLPGYYKLAEVYSKTENYGEAIRTLTRASEIESDNAETHFRLGTVQSARGSHDEAIAAYNKVLSLNDSFPGIYQSLGIAYEEKGEHNKAIECFKKSL